MPSGNHGVESENAAVPHLRVLDEDDVLDELHDEADAEADVGADVVDVPHGEVPLEEPPLLQLLRVLQLPQEIC